MQPTSSKIHTMLSGEFTETGGESETFAVRSISQTETSDRSTTEIKKSDDFTNENQPAAGDTLILFLVFFSASMILLILVID